MIISETIGSTNTTIARHKTLMASVSWVFEAVSAGFVPLESEFTELDSFTISSALTSLRFVRLAI
jgi:hypothetical protein